MQMIGTASFHLKLNWFNCYSVRRNWGDYDTHYAPSDLRGCRARLFSFKLGPEAHESAQFPSSFIYLLYELS
jgi:hypothetical protein